MMMSLSYMLNLIGYHTIRQGLTGMISVDQIEGLLKTAGLNNFRLGGSIGIVMVLISLGIAFLLIQYLLRPIRSLIQAARHLKEGRFDLINLQALTQRHDELGKLAQVFDEAADQVRQREERLKQVIEQLRIDINRDQETRQVEEITETDYFRSLRQRSLELRSRKERRSHEK